PSSSSLWVAGRDLPHSDPGRARRAIDLAVDQGARTQSLIIGPDSESEQWVSAVAEDAGAPYSVLQKVRRGDRDVEISIRDMQHLEGRTPVLVDDMISSGRTMLEAVRVILRPNAPRPICIAVHGLFADQSDGLLTQVGARVVTSNSVPHQTNDIDVGEIV